MYKQFMELDGIDISKEKMEVAPTAHYSMGGLVVDINCRTKIKGLFAVGEVISQIHGANRLGGNSLLDTIVFGKIAGEEAARLAKQEEKERGNTNKTEAPSQIQSNADNQEKGSIDDHYGDIFVVKEPISFRNEIQEVMKQNAGIVREEAKLQNGLKKILELKNEFYSKDNIIEASEIDANNSEKVIMTLQVKSSLVVCEAIIRSALMRQESRGAHYRSDFPKHDDQRWKVNIYCRKERKGASPAAAEMVLFKQNVKEIKGPLSDMVKVQHVKATHQREFE
jgi:succinate dehydrogenase/fumarate reductase flavoprotein subunit